MDRRRLLPVAVGAMIGTAPRWAALELAGPGGEDVALLLVNVVGSAALGAVLGVRSFGRLQGERGRDVLAAGMCGAFTSWSALSVQLAQQTAAGEWSSAVLWLSGHVILGVAAAAVSHTVITSTDREPA